VTHNLNFRLLVSFTVVIIVTIGTVFFFTYQTTRNEIAQVGESVEMNQNNNVQREISRYYWIVNSWDGVQDVVVQWGNLYGRRIILTDNNNTIVGDSADELLGQNYNSGLAGEDMTQLAVSDTGIFPKPQAQSTNRECPHQLLLIQPTLPEHFILSAARYRVSTRRHCNLPTIQ
jgi:hypothetical protein